MARIRRAFRHSIPCSSPSTNPTACSASSPIAACRRGARSPDSGCRRRCTPRVDSEGLLLLTDDGTLAHRLTDPAHRQAKVYQVQVEGAPTPVQLDALRAGVVLKDGPTRPARARLIPAPVLWPREPPVRMRRSVPDAWLELTISEGRNRQVRRMTATVGLPTLRLLRVAIGPWQLDALAPGEWRTLAC